MKLISLVRIATAVVFATSLARPVVAQTASGPITIDRVTFLLTALAHDSMEGRGTGTRGSMRAAKLIAEQFRLAGLTPAGDSGYFQHVPLVNRAPDANAALSVDGGSIKPYIDFLATVPRGPSRSLDGVPVIFGGVQGDTLNPLTADQVRGKLVILSPAAPGAGGRGGRGGGRGGRGGNAANPLAEAAGVATIVGDQLSAATVGNARRGGVSVKDPAAPVSTQPPAAAALTITTHGAEVLLGMPLAQATKGMIGKTVHGDLRVTETPALGGNVVGIVPGADPVLKDEIVLVDAHYDHLGIRTPAVPGADSIFNGADDDASGTTAVIEIARAIKAGPPPKRTIVFIATTGEETGLLGTNWYIAHPVRPLSQMVANLEIEMIGRPDSLSGGSGRAWLTGYERSNMGQMFATAGLPVVPDMRPGQNFFSRSDNIAFAQMGIPAHTLSTFNLHKDYHQASDETQFVDFVHMTGVINAGYGAVKLLANGPKPAWNPCGQPAARGATQAACPTATP